MSLAQFIQDLHKRFEEIQFTLLDAETLAVKNLVEGKNPTKDDNRSFTLLSNTGFSCMGDNNLINYNQSSTEEICELKEELKKETLNLVNEFKQESKNIQGHTTAESDRLKTSLNFIEHEVLKLAETQTTEKEKQKIKRLIDEKIQSVGTIIRDDKYKQRFQHIQALAVNILNTKEDSQLRCLLKNEMEAVECSLKEKHQKEVDSLKRELDQLRKQTSSSSPVRHGSTFTVDVKMQKNSMLTTDELINLILEKDTIIEEVKMHTAMIESQIKYKDNEIERINYYCFEVEKKLREAKLNVMEYSTELHHTHKEVGILKSSVVKAEDARRNAQLEFIRLVRSLEKIIDGEPATNKDDEFIEIEKVDDQYHLSIKANLDKIKTKISDVKELQKRIQLQRSSIEKLKSDLQNAADNYGKIMQTNSELRKDITDCKALNEESKMTIVKLTKGKQQSEEEIRSQRKQITEMEQQRQQSEEEIRSQRKTITEMEQQRQQSEEEIRSQRKKITEMEQQRKQSEEDIRSLRKKITEMEQQRQSEEDIRSLQKAITEMKQQIK